MWVLKKIKNPFEKKEKNEVGIEVMFTFLLVSHQFFLSEEEEDWEETAIVVVVVVDDDDDDEEEESDTLHKPKM